MYDLSPGCVPAEFEDVVELLLVAGELGGHASGLGASSGGGVDQYGLADGGELGEQDADRQAWAGALGFTAHQVGDLQGEYAGEHVHADVVLGPVEHRGERTRGSLSCRKENSASDWDR